MSCQTYQLSSGLRVVCERRSSHVLYCGYVVMAGTRFEASSDEGMAHFIEHMNFKGTRRRRACHITNGLERVGGDLNAYTTKHEVVYYASVLKEDFSRAVDLLTDIVFYSTYPEKEITKEAEVVCDEIDSYQDVPADLIFDEFETLIFPGQPLGRDILGRKEVVRRFTTNSAHSYAERLYRPENAVFYIYGDIDFERVLRLLERLLPITNFTLPYVPQAILPPRPRLTGLERRVKKDTQQLHLMVGGSTYAGTDDRRYALQLLNNIIGGPGMNARLNIEMREKAGLVYSVNSSLYTYPDAGYWAVYFGCDPRDEVKCRRILNRELKRFAETPLTPARLSAARKQIRGQVSIAAENAENYALAMGKHYAYFGECRNLKEDLERIDAVKSEEIRDIAAEVFAPERLSTLVYY